MTLPKQLSTFLTTAFCADFLHLSPSYFSDLLKSETGKTLSEYVQQKRLEIAQEMLIKQNLPIHTIAETLGFLSVRYFSTLFKKWTGLSPSEYKLPN